MNVICPIFAPEAVASTRQVPSAANVKTAISNQGGDRVKTSTNAETPTPVPVEDVLTPQAPSSV